MHTPRHDTLCVRLIFILILLIGLSINVCGDSEEENEVLIEEAAEPPVVIILDNAPPVPDRSDAEILADRILQQETDDFYFDTAQRNQLINEIEGVLSLIRSAYPLMNAIHIRKGVQPGMLWVDPERDFDKILKELLQDKQGQIRFETGNAEFDALNAKLGVQAVRWSSWGLSLYFDARLNLWVASEAYSMVEGVREVRRNLSFRSGSNILAFKQGETWYVIFKNGWGDCPKGCIYREYFCFTVTGTDVESIPTAQAQTMPPFQELGPWLRNRTPFLNAPAHRWSWVRGWFSAGDSPDLDDFAGGCPLFGEIEAFPNQLSVSCGYHVESLPREDRFFDDYEFTGVVLLLIATQERIVVGTGEKPFIVVLEPGVVFKAKSAVVSEPVRVAKTASEIEDPENVYFENVLMAINPPPLSSPFERWWGGVHPTFVVCWDHPQTGLRAYQVLTPNIMYADEASNQPGCDNFRDTDYIQTLDVYLPTGGERGRSMLRVPRVIIPRSASLENWRDWVDEVLPRPAAPE